MSDGPHIASITRGQPVECRAMLLVNDMGPMYKELHPVFRDMALARMIRKVANDCQ